MDEAELAQWMRKVEQRLARLEVQGDSTPGAPDLPDTIPAPPVTMTWQKVAGAFNKRYEVKRELAWHYGPHQQHLIEIAEWVDRQSGDGLTIAKRLLDNWFDTHWAAKVDYKPKFLAENLGSVYSPPVVERKDEPDAEAINARRLAESRRQKEMEVEAKLAENRRKPVPPPGSLDEMMATIGKTLK